MCDTLIATPDVTADGVMLFGKNSDRDPNEAQMIKYFPAADHAVGETLQCTYITIPQVPHTHGVLLSKPFWIWGAEMGINDQNVAIGNEAIFSKVPASKKQALLGMDLLRLALERASTAEEAVKVITELLVAHGQGGNCGFQNKSFYHNSFLIADPLDAWVLETVGNHWAAKKVKGVYTISNVLTIGSEFDLASPDLVKNAVEKGWCKERDDFDFSRCYSDFLYTTFSDARNRCSRTSAQLYHKRGQITPRAIIAALRDHGEAATDGWRPDRGLMGADICMHAGYGPIRISQTTGSLVSHLHPEHPTHFVTGTAAPCTSIFKPVWLDAHPTNLRPDPSGSFDPETLFWRHERLHRSVLEDYPTRLASYRKQRDEMEGGFFDQALSLVQASIDKRKSFSANCFQQAWQVEDQWYHTVKDQPIEGRRGWLHKLAWDQFNKQTGMPD